MDGLLLPGRDIETDLERDGDGDGDGDGDVFPLKFLPNLNLQRFLLCCLMKYFEGTERRTPTAAFIREGTNPKAQKPSVSHADLV